MWEYAFSMLLFLAKNQFDIQKYWALSKMAILRDALSPLNQKMSLVDHH
jgi:hypothetical protein